MADSAAHLYTTGCHSRLPVKHPYAIMSICEGGIWGGGGREEQISV